MTAGGNWKCKVRLERKEMIFWVLNKADSRRCSYIILFYCCTVQSANTKPTTTGQDVVCAQCQRLWWEWESRARLVLCLPLCHCSGDSASPSLSALGVAEGVVTTAHHTQPEKCDSLVKKQCGVLSLRGSISLVPDRSSFHCQLLWDCSCFQLLPIKHFAGLTMEASAK